MYFSERVNSPVTKLSTLSRLISMDRYFNRLRPRSINTSLKEYSPCKSTRDQIVNPFPSEIKKASVQLAIYVIVTLFVATKGRNSTDPALLASNNTSLALL